MSNPDEKQKPVLEKHVQTILLSVITALLLGMFNFLWTMNRDFAKMEERDRLKGEQFQSMQNSVNKIQLDLFDLKERVTRMESRQGYQAK